VTISILMLMARRIDSQFLYPTDDNLDGFITTLNCYSCKGEGCGEIQDEMGNNTESCSAARVGCWILRNMESGEYTRTCEKPASIRQGVFCNRHMSGREFCYGYESPSGRVRICAKCCLNDRCNFGVLEGRPHPELQTCVVCDGSTDEFCNDAKTVRDLEDSSYTEQCLFPRSDCWKERRVVNQRATYVRGCQLLECDEHNIKENCTIHDDIQEEKCTKCCENNLCNRLQFEAPYNKAGGSNASTFVLLIFSALPTIFFNFVLY